MPGLDTSTYALAHLRLDGRRWNELRRIHGQISTQSSADGSSVFSMGNTTVLCTVSGPQEVRRVGARDQANVAKIDVEINLAAFSQTDRKRRSKSDKRISEMSHTISSAFSNTLFTHLYPHSTITINLHVLSQDGSLLAACLNASTLALVDAGIPMSGYIAACTTGSTAAYADKEEEADPVLDLNGLEELELPFLTVAAGGGKNGTGDEEDKVNVLIMETKVQMARLEAMISVGLDGCKQVRSILDGVVREHGRKVLEAKVG
ncbi:ribosomal protein S5 domain 2-like protein [Teratosphaeria destructans]|uniref:Ribosomal RNA-processing protein 41 n=1 Tax=Teratosphaeria destructans TaxID=418781 RepID=A0A9W7SX21_9PEZI|nr:ribosomal protein S5 domain 2-like protein [Teratosphaeria destructans]